MTTVDVPVGGADPTLRSIAVDMAKKAGIRLLHLDACKGILITLVLFGHSIQYFSYASSGQFWSDPVFKFIYMFHMPLFAAYSGYFSPGRAVIRQDVMKRIVTLILPMIVWVVIAWCIHAAITADLSRAPLTALKEILVSRYWFIWAIFFSLAACYLCESVLRRPRLGYAAIFLVLLLQGTASDSIAKFGFIFPYFVAGRLLRTEPALAAFASANRGVLFALGAVGTAIAYRYWTHDTYIYNNHLQTMAAPGQIALMLAGSACATVFAAIGIDWIARRVVNTSPGRMLQRIGVVTMEIYLVQSIFFAEAPRLARPFLGPDAPALGTRLALAVAVCALSLVLIMAVIALTRRSAVVGRALWGR
ncbi:acyltransferase family protein [Novosphingobium gossypii]|uniref:acyltransferase family protein n=1 Tax=Novosphingobium gossypii TaxID=1604774 RepID=UPI003D21F9D5